MSGRFLLDTNIVIAIFAEEAAVLEFVAAAEEVFVPAVVLAVVPAARRPALGGSSPTGPLHLKQLVTDDDFKKMGLQKLSPAELTALEKWLGTYTSGVVATVRQGTAPSARSESALRRAEPATPDAVESTIEGDFEGWSGETIFKLDNGQIWQQAEYDYTYEYAYRPEVTIYKTAAGYWMKVEDVDETILVKRLK
jgi:hypothetical protein